MLNFLKFKQNPRNQYKNKVQKKMSEVQDKVKQYQWIKGDSFGKIVDVESKDNEFTIFTDGSRIFNNVISEFLKEVIDGEIPLPGADKLVNLVNGTSDKIETEKSKGSIPSKANSKVDSEITVVGKMIQKMSKKNVVNVPVQINLNIPTPAIFAMLSEGMEEDDLNNEIMAVVMDQIEFNKLQDYIKGNISDFIAEYYS